MLQEKSQQLKAVPKVEHKKEKTLAEMLQEKSQQLKPVTEEMKEENRKKTAAILNVGRAKTGTLANLAAIINFHTKNTKRSRYPTHAANSENTSNQSSDSDSETDSSEYTDSDEDNK